jgi:hypothetical protein
MSSVLENQDKAQKNVLLKILGVLLVVLGILALLFTGIGIIVVSAYGADAVVILLLLLFTAIGIGLLYVGSKLITRF